MIWPTAQEAVKEFPGRAKAFRAETQSRRGTKKTTPLIFPSLCASASLREIVYFFSFAVSHIMSPATARFRAFLAVREGLWGALGASASYCDLLTCGELSLRHDIMLSEVGCLIGQHSGAEPPRESGSPRLPPVSAADRGKRSAVPSLDPG